MRCASRRMRARTSTHRRSWQQAELDEQNASATWTAASIATEKMEITEAREAVERAEDARITSLRKQAAEQRAGLR